MDDAQKAAAFRAEVIAVLRDIEFRGWSPTEGWVCPYCRARSHTPECRLAALLGGGSK